MIYSRIWGWIGSVHRGWLMCSQRRLLKPQRLEPSPNCDHGHKQRKRKPFKHILAVGVTPPWADKLSVKCLIFTLLACFSYPCVRGGEWAQSLPICFHLPSLFQDQRLLTSSSDTSPGLGAGCAPQNPPQKTLPTCVGPGCALSTPLGALPPSRLSKPKPCGCPRAGRGQAGLSRAEPSWEGAGGSGSSSSSMREARFRDHFWVSRGLGWEKGGSSSCAALPGRSPAGRGEGARVLEEPVLGFGTRRGGPCGLYGKRG